MRIVRLADGLRFDSDKMRKNTLFETERFFCDLYCLEPGQGQKPHTHEGSDKVYLVMEGEGTFLVGEEEVRLGVGQGVLAESGEVHGVTNEGPGQLVCLVFMAPHPKPPGRS